MRNGPVFPSAVGSTYGEAPFGTAIRAYRRPPHRAAWSWSSMPMATPDIRMAIAASESETVLKVAMGSVGIIKGDGFGSAGLDREIPPSVLKPPGVIWAFRKTMA